MPKVTAQRTWAPQLLVAHGADQPGHPSAMLGPQGRVSPGWVGWPDPRTCVLGPPQRVVGRSKPGNQHPAEARIWLGAILPEAPARPRCEEEPAGPASQRPLTRRPRPRDPASTFLCVGMSLLHVLPVTATTSSRPLRELFLTDLCISCMRKT